MWSKEAQRHPKLEMIGRLMENECEGCCMLVKFRRGMMMNERVERWYSMYIWKT